MKTKCILLDDVGLYLIDLDKTSEGARWLCGPLDINQWEFVRKSPDWSRNTEGHIRIVFGDKNQSQTVEITKNLETMILQAKSKNLLCTTTVEAAGTIPDREWPVPVWKKQTTDEITASLERLFV